MADHSEKILKVIGTDEIEMMFEDDFEEDNKKIAKIKEKEQNIRTEKATVKNSENDNKNKSRQRLKLKSENTKKLDKTVETFEKEENIQNGAFTNFDKKNKN